MWLLTQHLIATLKWADTEFPRRPWKICRDKCQKPIYRQKQVFETLLLSSDKCEK